MLDDARHGFSHYQSYVFQAFGYYWHGKYHGLDYLKYTNGREEYFLHENG